MIDEKLSTFYDVDKRHNHIRSDVLKFLLMPFAFFVILGFSDRIGGYISTYSNFVGQVFFILYGFYSLVPDKTQRVEKIKKNLKRSFKFFIVMFICFIILNVIYLASVGALKYLVSEAILRKRTFFNFFVLNVWPLPVGNSIWFVQSLMYAYLFFLIAEKIKLNRFYLPVMIVLILFMLATGEFAAFCGFPYFGYTNLPGGAFTRAVPYMLIGMYLRKHVDKLDITPRYFRGSHRRTAEAGAASPEANDAAAETKDAVAETHHSHSSEAHRHSSKSGRRLHRVRRRLKKIRRGLAKKRHFLYLILFPVGLAAAIAELELLNHYGKLVYIGHTVGFGIMAISLCCFALSRPAEKNNYLTLRAGKFAKQMYALCQPVSFIIWMICVISNSLSAVRFERAHDCLISLAVCLLLVFGVDFIRLKLSANGRLGKRIRKWFKSKFYYVRHKFHKLQRKIKK